MKPIVQSVFGFMVSAATVFALTTSDSALAWQRISAFECFANLNDYSGDFAVNMGGIENRAGGWRPRDIQCSVPNVDDVAVGSLWVTGFDGDNGTWPTDNFRIKGCSTRWFDGFLDCSSSFDLTPATTTFTGTFATSAHPDVAAFLNHQQHRHIVVNIPPGGAFGMSRLVGYEVF